MINAIVTDIDGTLSPLHFVQGVLLPYVNRRLPDFIEEHRDDPSVAALLAESAALAGLDTDDTEALISRLLSWSEEDRKAPPLKSLQGLIWEEGYRQGAFRAPVYLDAAKKLAEWHDESLPIYAYSSASAYAQRLFFAHTETGDLLHLFSGFFDTRIGDKRDSDAFERIAEAVECPAGEILFLSDVCAELDAAREAGMRTCLLQRPDNRAPGDRNGHPVAEDFDEITF